MIIGDGSVFLPIVASLSAVWMIVRYLSNGRRPDIAVLLVYYYWFCYYFSDQIVRFEFILVNTPVNTIVLTRMGMLTT